LVAWLQISINQKIRRMKKLSDLRFLVGCEESQAIANQWTKFLLEN